MCRGRIYGSVHIVCETSVSGRIPSNFNIPQKPTVPRTETVRNTSSTATVTENGCSGRLWASIVIQLLKLLCLWGIGPMGQRNLHIFRFLSSLHLGDWLPSVTESHCLLRAWKSDHPWNFCFQNCLLKDLELCSNGRPCSLLFWCWCLPFGACCHRPPDGALTEDPISSSERKLGACVFIIYTLGVGCQGPASTKILLTRVGTWEF